MSKRSQADLRSYLEAGERIQYRFKPVRGLVVYGYIGLLAAVWLLIGGGLGAIFFFSGLILGGVLFIVISFILFAPIGVYLFLRWYHCQYVITDRRVLVQRGWLIQTLRETDFDQITDTAVVRPIQARLFKAGTVSFSTAGSAMKGKGTGKAAVVWGEIRYPLKVRSKVADIIKIRKAELAAERTKAMAVTIHAPLIEIPGATRPDAFCGECGHAVESSTAFCGDCGTSTGGGR